MINKDRNQPYNELPLLPIGKESYENTEILRLLGESKSKLGELKGLARLIKNQGMLINSVSLQEAKASSEIENIFTTQDELYAAFSDMQGGRGASKEVLNYREAIWTGFQGLKSKSIIQEEDIIEIYRIIKGVTDGYRDHRRKTIIRKRGSSLTSGEVIYTPPRGKGIVEEKMENLIDYLNKDEEDPLLKMCVGHYQFEAIHPFSDGNGRTGRIMNVLYLTQTGFLNLPILFLSKYILENKNDYYFHLSGVSQRGDWKSWVKFMLSAVLSTASYSINLINSIVEAEEYVKTKIKEDFTKLYSEELIETLFTQPYTTVKQLVNKGVGSEKTCRKYMEILSEGNTPIMKRMVISGKVYYENIELVKAFEV